MFIREDKPSQQYQYWCQRSANKVQTLTLVLLFASQIYSRIKNYVMKTKYSAFFTALQTSLYTERDARLISRTFTSLSLAMQFYRLKSLLSSAGTLNLIRLSVRLSFRPCLSVCHKNFNLGHNFCTITGRALVLGMCVLCEKTFPMVPCYDLDHDLWPTSRSNLLPSGGPQFSEFACLELFDIYHLTLTGLQFFSFAFTVILEFNPVYVHV